jgi:SPP1 gp7 family putative phage head morphogenesis protein
MLSDPAHISKEIRQLQKKLANAIRLTHSKSLKNLLLYTNVNEFERTMLIANFDVLLESVTKDMKRDTWKSMNTVYLIAYYYYELMYRQSRAVYKVPIPEFVMGEVPPPTPTQNRIMRVDDEVSKIYMQRTEALFDRVHSDLRTGVIETLTRGRLEGWSDTQLKKELDKHFERAEMFAMRIAVTEMQYSYNSIIINEAKRNGVRFLTWVTQADEFVCDTCRPRHLKSYPIDDLPENPAHTRCRCSWVISRVR